MVGLNLDYIYYQLYRLLTDTGLFTPESLRAFWSVYSVIATIVSVLLLTTIIYVAIRNKQVMQFEYERFRALHELAQRETSEGKLKNHKWDRIVGMTESENPNDWRLAVLEADVLLDELVTQLGYQGESLGEKLKSADKGSFHTLNQAWEAHKIRNQIAHAGSDYTLTSREARRAVELFRQVFEEFRFI